MVINIAFALILQILLLYLNKKINYSYEQKVLPFLGSLILAVITSIKFIKQPYTSNLFTFHLYGILILTLGICLMNIAFIDYKYLEIPDTYNVFIFLLGLANVFYYRNIYFLIISAISFGLFFIIAIITGRALGSGDVKLSVGLGLFFNLPKYSRFLMLTFGIGALVGLILLILKLKEKEDKIPFGPFMALGAILAILI